MSAGDRSLVFSDPAQLARAIAVKHRRAAPWFDCTIFLVREGAGVQVTEGGGTRMGLQEWGLTGYIFWHYLTVSSFGPMLGHL